jgi:hypothetical protein
MIIAWPIPDPIVSKLRLLFVTMSQGRIIDAVSLSTVCEPHVHGYKHCAELALQILGALRDSSSGILRCKIAEFVCFHLITRFRSRSSERPDSSLLWFFLRLLVLGSSTLIQCLDSFFARISLQAEVLKTQQHFISSFPMFLFLNLGCEKW